MRSRFFRKEIPFFTLMVLVISALALASESRIVKMQGPVEKIDLQNKMLVVYESTFFWNQNTIFNNEAGSRVTIDQLKPKGWIYIIADYDKASKRKVAKKIYLLPKHIDAIEREQYPFMEQK